MIFGRFPPPSIRSQGWTRLPVELTQSSITSAIPRRRYCLTSSATASRCWAASRQQKQALRHRRNSLLLAGNEAPCSMVLANTSAAKSGSCLRNVQVHAVSTAKARSAERRPRKENLPGALCALVATAESAGRQVSIGNPSGLFGDAPHSSLPER